MGKKGIDKGISKKTVMSFTVHFLPSEEGGYTVEVPALPGCVTEGDTFEEAEKNAREAIELYLITLYEDGEPIPYEGETVVKRITVPMKSVRV